MKWDKKLHENFDDILSSNGVNKLHSRQKKLINGKVAFDKGRKIGNKPHSRDKKVNGGKASVEKNRRIIKKSINSIKSRDAFKYISKIKKYMNKFI